MSAVFPIGLLHIDQFQVAVLGDMRELGEGAESEHAAVGKNAARLGIDWLCWLGEWADTVVRAARNAGMDPSRLLSAKTHGDLAHQVSEFVARGDWILVKGSRGMQMERVIEELKAKGSR